MGAGFFFRALMKGLSMQVELRRGRILMHRQYLDKTDPVSCWGFIINCNSGFKVKVHLIWQIAHSAFYIHWGFVTFRTKKVGSFWLPILWIHCCKDVNITYTMPLQQRVHWGSFWRTGIGLGMGLPSLGIGDLTGDFMFLILSVGDTPGNYKKKKKRR